MKKIVVCMKWGNLFDAKYVNALFSAVKRNTHDLDDFICITEDPSGLNTDIKILPIPDMPIDRTYYLSGAWPKLGLFKSGFLPRNSRILFIDLDMMICGNLNKFFDFKGALCAIGPGSWERERNKYGPIYRHYKERRARIKNAKQDEERRILGIEKNIIKPNTLGSGIFCFYGDELQEVYEKFIKNVNLARVMYSNEQHFLEFAVDHYRAWPLGWVVHYKYNLRQPLLVDIFRHPLPPPETASVVAFSGKPRPHELSDSYFSSLKEFPHLRIGKVRWFREYWQNNG
jgi:hypothetical protein